MGRIGYLETVQQSTHMTSALIVGYIVCPRAEGMRCPCHITCSLLQAYSLYMGWQICQTQNCALCTIHIHKGMWHHCVKQAKLILITIWTFSRFYSLLSSFQNVHWHVLSTHKVLQKEVTRVVSVDLVLYRTTVSLAPNNLFEVVELAWTCHDSKIVWLMTFMTIVVFCFAMLNSCELVLSAQLIYGCCSLALNMYKGHVVWAFGVKLEPFGPRVVHTYGFYGNSSTKCVHCRLSIHICKCSRVKSHLSHLYVHLKVKLNS